MKLPRVLLVIVTLFLVASVGTVASGPILYHFNPVPPRPISLMITNSFVIGFCVTHAVLALGWRHALAFLSISSVVSWYLENVGVESGAIYGGYHYTSLLGPPLGHVPVIIPLSWFMYIYCSYILANILLGRRLAGSDRVPVRLITSIVVTAILTTAQDLVVDPVMSGEVIRAWVWETPGAYFGVPATNFVGWLVTALLVGGAYRLLEIWRPPKPVAALSRLTASMPVLVFGLNAYTSLFPPSPSGLSVIGPFVVGLPTLLGLAGIWLPSRLGPLEKGASIGSPGMG